MLYAFGIVLFFLLLMMLSLVSTIFGIIRSVISFILHPFIPRRRHSSSSRTKRSTTYSADSFSSDSSSSDSSSSRSSNTGSHKKLFAPDEGEYVDFEEM